MNLPHALRRLFLILCAAVVTATGAQNENEVTAKPPTQRDARKRAKRARQELQSAYRNWLNQDVVWIITPEERTAFTRLQTDDEREQFIEQFWRRRDPTPDTAENEFREEHYRRIAYANDHFTSGVPGWKTDRGHIYIVYGPPDEIESHPSGGSYQATPEEGGGEMTTYPFERWRYRYLENVGTNIVLEFVDPSGSGEYHLTIDPQEKNALAHVPGGANTLLPQTPAQANIFDRLQLLHDINQAPRVKFPELQAAVASRVSYNLLPLKLRADYIPLTESTVLTNITVQFDTPERATINLYGRITSITHRVVGVFEDTVVSETGAVRSLYQKSVPLQPGTYRLNLACKEITTGNMNTYETALVVPRLEPDKFAASSLVLADRIEKVPAREIGAGQFVIGDSKVRPRVDSSFRRDESLGIYMRLYGFTAGQVEYEVFRTGSNERVLSYSEPLQNPLVEKMVPLRTLTPGEYTIRVRIVDAHTSQTLTRSATFTIL